MIIYGRRKIRIKKYDDYQIKCENCNGFDHRFSIYQEYFHVFFIPIFPSSIKTIKCVCLKCNDTFNQTKKEHYLSITRTPVFLYSGVILLIGLITAGLIGNIYTQSQKSELVKKPKIGDVYQIRENAGNLPTYYFVKIKNIHLDTVELFHGNLVYNRFVSFMNDSDYFVKSDIYKVFKSDLKIYLDSGLIISVERDYKKDSRFSIEK